jgi:ribosomal protein S6--L-glutamate ligase
VIDPPAALAEHTRVAMSHLGADILALDFLETQEGEYVLIEANDTPGLSGFPEQLREHLANCLRSRITAR